MVGLWRRVVSKRAVGVAGGVTGGVAGGRAGTGNRRKVNMDAPIRRDERLLLIGGKWVEAGGGTYDVINPATEEVVGTAPDATVTQAAAAASAARAALPSWSSTSIEERSALLRAAADAIRQRANDLLPLVIAETGATAVVGARLQVPQAAVRFQHYSADPSRVLRTPLLPQAVGATPLAPGGLIGGMVNRQPVGVVACVTSYNFPMVNMAGKVAPALAAGNTVVVKPAPQDPLAVVELVRILDEVGFPPGVVNLVTSASPDPAAALVDSPEVDMVSFTGSTGVGTKIMEAAGRTMKRLLLELGGKGACIVLDDADLSSAVTCISSTWTFHSGQICTAPTRAVVHRSVFDEVRDRLAAMAGSLVVGDPTDRRTIVGPVISAAQRDRIEGYVGTAGPEGGEVVAGGDRPAMGKGFYVAPTLVTGDNSMTVAREEIFGPVITMIPFDDDDEAVAIANDSPYGLYDYVFSKDGSRAFGVATRLQAGHVGINTAQRNHDAPFGGFKMSGVGRDGGDYGLLAYSEPQSILWP